MNNSKVLSVLAILSLVVSCMVTEPEGADLNPAAQQKEITITATSGEPDTRTERAADGSVLWSPGDQISLFYGSGADGGSCFTAQNTETAKTVNFTGTIGVITGGNNIAVEDTYFWAVYPYNATASCDGNSITTVLPSEQVAIADTFADDLFPSMGRSQGLNMAFYNICGGLKFTVSEEGIKSVTLRSNAGEHIAGKITAGYDDNGLPVVTNIADGTDYVTLTAPIGETLEVGRAYYLVFVPTVFESGFTLTFSKGYSQAVMNRTAKTTIRRSVFGLMTNPDAGLVWEMPAYITIPDPNFSAYMLLHFDTNGNGVLDLEEAQTVTNLDINTNDMESLDGIAYCANLQRLRIFSSDNNSKLTRLDVRFNTALTSLSCYNNQLTSLDVSKNTSLEYLSCYNNQLTSLDVSKNTALQRLDCSRNQLTSLDVSNNTALTELSCYQNQLIALDVNKNTALTELHCYENQLTSLDVSSNTALINLRCGFNQLTSLDVRANTALTCLNCDRNLLTSLDLSANTALTELYCSSNRMTSLDLSNNTALSTLYCYYGRLTSIDVINNHALTLLHCYGNQLAALDVSNNTALTSLCCDNNQLTTLDVSNNTVLTDLNCHRNLLTALDLSSNKSLVSLNCFGNMISGVDVSKNHLLSYLDCSPMNNSLGNNVLETLIIAEGQSIPNVTEDRNSNYVPDATRITSVPVFITITVPDAVDMGLSVKWASFNLGADAPQEFGYYYAWGETEIKADYSWSMYKWCNGSSEILTKYNTKESNDAVDNKIVLDLEDDVAHMELGGSWRMPTDAEWNELYNSCTWEWTTWNGIKGYKVTSEIAGYSDKSIFLPASGYRKDAQLYSTVSSGYYWSSSLVATIPDYAWRLCFSSSYSHINRGGRCYGYSVRPVTE